MASFSVKKAAITMVLTQELGSCRLWLRFIHIMFEIMSHLVVMSAAWNCTAYVIPVYLLLHFLMTRQVMDLSVRQLLEAPLLWLFPTSRLIASNRPCAARGARLCSWALRWALAVVAVMVVVVAMFDGSLDKFSGEQMCHQHPSHSCQGLPPWLQTPRYQTWWHGSSPTCRADHEVYGSCLSELPWYKRSFCNYMAGFCAVGAFPPWLMILSGVMTAGVPNLTLVFGALLDLCTCCSKQLAEVPSTRTTPAVNTATGEAGWVKKTSYALVTVGPFFLDVGLDVNGILQYLLTGNFIFAAVSAVIFFASLSQQFARGALSKLWNATLESLKIGESTEDLEKMMLSEKAVEAPLQLFLQFYAFPFVTSSDVAVLSKISGGHRLAELKLHDALVAQEYESLLPDEKKTARSGLGIASRNWQ